MEYNQKAFEIRKTDAFKHWFEGLRDRMAIARIQSRIDRLQLGLLGDSRPVGKGVFEMRIDHGPGYRVYFIQLGKQTAILLVGGTKRSQSRDIERALEYARILREEE